MGLFDKRDKRKQSDDFDSPVEQIDLSAPPALDPDEEDAAGAAAAAPEPPASAKVAEEPEDESPPAIEYGIQQAIELMRTLPSENVELVVRVVKHTLESTHIKIPTIIDDATRKQESIQGRIKVLKEEIGELEKEIATRRGEIGRLEADFAETSTVKERLVLAERLAKKEKEAEAASGGRSGNGQRSGTQPPSGRSGSARPKSPTEPPPRAKSSTDSPPARTRSPSQAPPSAKAASTVVSTSAPEKAPSAAGKK